MRDTPEFHSIHALSILIRQVRGLPDGEGIDALFSACMALGGTVTQPGSASHMHEISVLGVYARAHDRQELVLNWMSSAKALCGSLADSIDVTVDQTPTVAIDFHPERRGIQLAEVATTIARPDRHDDNDLISACQIILAHSRDHCECGRACQLAAALGHCAPGERSA